MSEDAHTAHPTPALSVVIPTLGRPTLHEQLGSLASCAWGRPWEVIIADNSADQLARTICAEWTTRLPSLRHIDASGRSGRSHAVNRGAQNAQAPNLLFLDDDDHVCETIIERVGDALVAGAQVVVFNFDVRSLNASNVWSSCDHEQIETQRPMFRSAPAVWGCAGIDRELFLGLGGFDETFPYAEDLEFTLRLHDATGLVPLWIPERLLKYRLRSTSLGRFRQRAQIQRAVMHLSSSHPHHVSAASRNRYKGLVVDVVRCGPQLRRGLGRQARLELADQSGTAWGRFTGSDTSSSASVTIAASAATSTTA